MKNEVWIFHTKYLHSCAVFGFKMQAGVAKIDLCSWQKQVKKWISDILLKLSKKPFSFTELAWIYLFSFKNYSHQIKGYFCCCFNILFTYIQSSWKKAQDVYFNAISDTYNQWTPFLAQFSWELPAISWYALF